MIREPEPERSLRQRASQSSEALVAAVGDLANQAVDRVLLSNERITSADEAKRLLAAKADTEALGDNIQRVVVLAVPVARRLLRGARFTRAPWVMIASSAVTVGIAVRTGVRELQLVAALVAYRLEEAGVPYDPALVKKLAIDLYLHPRRAPDPADGGLRLGRLTRKWILSGALGRNSSKRARRALDSAEKLDATSAAARWASRSAAR
jgi:hypothetical protein